MPHTFSHWQVVRDTRKLQKLRYTYTTIYKVIHFIKKLILLLYFNKSSFGIDSFYSIHTYNYDFKDSLSHLNVKVKSTYCKCFRKPKHEYLICL